MRTTIAASFLMLWASVSPAQTLPKTSGDPLEEICSGFLEQNSLKVGGDMAKLCTCLVREVKGQLSRTEMETYDRLNAAAKPLPNALQNKVTNIALQCLTAAQ
jgi:hypothetical protein